MFLTLASFVVATSLARCASIPHQDPNVLNARQNTGDPGLQDIPTTAKPDNTFSNGAAMTANWPASDLTPPAVYGNRTIDLPFGRLYVRNHQLHVPFLASGLEPSENRALVYCVEISRSSVSHSDRIIY